jgi:type II secretory pathway pseudopilin PulG
MKTELPSEVLISRGARGFSLVEVTVAIGIFAFVIVGVLGLLPTATKLRADSAMETRAVMIAQQLFSYVESSGGSQSAGPGAGVTFSVNPVALRDGPALARNNTRTNINLLSPGGVVLGYQNRSSMPYYLFPTAAAWTNMPASVPGGKTTTDENEITIIARAWATNVPGDCSTNRVVVEVRSPASAPLTNNAGQINPSVRVLRFVKFF